ncbi:hypothetical protein [Bradyrhizobium diversitatis]|uniref:Uncharacterized protein n=1 Tax=Bradyrhizobium diversitatis TaxID=2755406 RepID=A0ABS0PFX3_9BRAD|nr:hypothetical protein [Bradyrhizobium diversitatis]MBH5392088.1 hypothetical protein [Bradyrhizobium diversitatis]
MTVLQIESSASPKPPPADTSAVVDAQFHAQVGRLKSLADFLSQEGLGLLVSDDENAKLAKLFALSFGEGGRAPTADEWADLIRFNQVLFQALTDDQRKRFLLGNIPSRLANLPLVFALLSFGSLLGCVLILPFVYSGISSDSLDMTTYKVAAMPFYLVWLMSMGAIGSTAFIGMNALLVQEDITFDLLNTKLISLRVALGSIFALVLGAPFAHEGFMKFLEKFLFTKANVAGSITDGLALILPFVLGFSTSVVITIMNRFIEATLSFFGYTPKGKVPGKIKGAK